MKLLIFKYKKLEGMANNSPLKFLYDDDHHPWMVLHIGATVSQSYSVSILFLFSLDPHSPGDSTSFRSSNMSISVCEL
jgi:hypothetical protein